eukprot:7780421-Ditylum_brightwellii.AAC.1
MALANNPVGKYNLRLNASFIAKNLMASVYFPTCFGACVVDFTLGVSSIMDFSFWLLFFEWNCAQMLDGIN